VAIEPPLLSGAPTDPQAYRITFRTEPMTETEQTEQYFRTNISALSPEPAVLGGTLYVTNVAFPEVGKAVVSYEDGHIAFVADVVYDISPTNGVVVREFTIRAEK
jgi:ABC-type iron transport system FetAB ATPase subunit